MNVEELILELSESRVEASKALASGDLDRWMNLVGSQTQLELRIQEALINDSTLIVTDEKARHILDEIGVADFVSDDDIDNLGEEFFYSRYSTSGYLRNLCRIRPLIAAISIPENLQVFVEEAKQCYAFQQPNAVYSLSRTILEVAINDICIRIGRMPRKIMQEDSYQEWSFSKRLSMVSSGGKYERIRSHYQLLCSVVHGSITIDNNRALFALAETLDFVRDLYLIHRHAIGAG